MASSIKKGSYRLSLFIGADLPQSVTGLPARADLARELAARYDLSDGLSLAEVAQRVSREGHRFEFTDFLRRSLDTDGLGPQPFHHNVAALVQTHEIQTILTTAYDSLLETAFKERDIRCNRVIHEGDIHFLDPGRMTLIKLYGDVEYPDSLVVTDRDHLDLVRDRDKEGIVDEVRRVFRQDTVLFLGYNLADPDFRFIFDQIAQSSFARTAYAVWPGMPKSDVQMWRDRGIIILPTDPWGVLGDEMAPVAFDPYPEPELAVSVSLSDLKLVRQLNVFPSPAQISPPVQARLQDLPFNELSWEQFEALCAALVESNPAVIDCHLFGVRGDFQAGIDIVATQKGREGEENWAYQCKRYKEYSVGELRQAFEKMEYPADYYVLMLSVPATAAMRKAVAGKSDSFLWDSRDIARKLKKYPTIVGDFFGSTWRQAFCGG